VKPTLKAHGTKRLKLKFDILLSNFGFKFNLRRYKTDAQAEDRAHRIGQTKRVKVGRCRLKL
jgi:hypothetical protein